MKALIAILLLVAANAMPSDISEYPVLPADLKETVSGFADMFTGLWEGFSTTAVEDISAFPACLSGFPCAYSVVTEFIEYVREMKEFDITKFGKKLFSLLFMGVYGCIQPCMIPYTYYMHFSPFLEGFNLNTTKEALMNGVLYNIGTLIFSGKDAYTSLMNQNFYQFGVDMGVIFWCVLIR